MTDVRKRLWTVACAVALALSGALLGGSDQDAAGVQADADSVRRALQEELGGGAHFDLGAIRQLEPCARRVVCAQDIAQVNAVSGA